jgi:hypothetical protein
MKLQNPLKLFYVLLISYGMSFSMNVVYAHPGHGDDAHSHTVQKANETKKLSKKEIEERKKAIDERCMKIESCAKRLAEREKKLAEERKDESHKRGKDHKYSEEELAARKKERDERCKKSKECAARMQEREKHRAEQQKMHVQLENVNDVFKAWCSKNKKKCAEYNQVSREVFEGISAIQPTCEKNYNQCVEQLKVFVKKQRDAWKPFCKDNAKLCKEQDDANKLNKTRYQKRRVEQCEAQPELAICNKNSKGFSEALEEANASI